MLPYPRVMDFSLSLKSTRISFRGSRQCSITRRSSIVSVWSIWPRFSMTNCIMSPMYSFGTMR